jgi:hypothetical protein
MSTLRHIFYNQLTLPSIKWEPYFDIYETHMAKYQGQSINLVEVGVMGGGSLEMWHKYLGPKVHIWGIDMDPRIQMLNIPNTTLVLGDQSDLGFWQRFLPSMPPIHIFVDDGSHVQADQLLTFEQVWPHMAPGGVYICEDCHTCYWREYGGGLRGHTFIEMSKAVVDFMNRDHLREPLPNDSYVNLVHDVGSVTFYDSVVVITKGRPTMTWAETPAR